MSLCCYLVHGIRPNTSSESLLVAIGKATPRKFLVSHFIVLKNTCGQAVHYLLFIIDISTNFQNS